MGFLVPLSLLLAALAVPIVLLYMLKLRRQDVLVSSTLLWQRLMRDREANAPWQRLRRNLLLLLQLLLLALLVLALARPFVPTRAAASGSVVVLLDTSASMQAQDVQPTRFEAARQAAQEIVAGMGPGDVATLIAAGPQPQVLVSASSDRAILRRALERAQATSGPADWESAFALAAAALTGASDARAVLISDGALPAALPPLPGEVRYVSVGGGTDNLAITALATRAGSGGTQAFVHIENFGTVDAEPLLEFSVDGALFDARRLRVPAGGSADLTLSDLPAPPTSPSAGAGVLEARLQAGDALPIDDVAWAVQAQPVSGRVLLVSPGNLFLERALGTLPGVELVRMPPEQFALGGSEAYDLYVVDGALTGTLPLGNWWLIAPPRAPHEADGGPVLDVGATFTNTTITRVAADDPLLRYVDLSSVHVLQARHVTPPPGARTLVQAAGGPLLVVAERPQGRLAVLTFNLHDSDLPLQIAFPILTANLVSWLLPGRAAQLPAAVQPGSAVPIQPAPEARQVLVTAPDGTRHRLPAGPSAPVFAGTDQPGVYRVDELASAGGDVLSSAAFAVNLFDAAESNIAPRDAVYVGQTQVAAAAREEEGQRELWPWLAAAALALLLAEWWVYQRGAAAPWAQRARPAGRRAGKETSKETSRKTRRKRG